MRRTAFAIAAIAALGACKMPGERQDIGQLTHDFVYESLALSPVAATGAGYHEHNGRKLDREIDDWSLAGVREQRRFYRNFLDHLSVLNQASLSAEDKTDYRIMHDAAELQMLELDRIRNWRHNPTMYVELAGAALFTPYVLEYAPLEERYRDIIARLDRVPGLMRQARDNLINAPSIWVEVAQQENDGTIGLIDKTLRDHAPADLKREYDKAAAIALESLRNFNAYLKNDLTGKPGEWRLGKQNYVAKFRLTLAVDRTPEQMLAEAEQALRETQQQMAQLAAPQTVRVALDRIAQQHPTPGDYMQTAKNDLAEATAFVKHRDLVPLQNQSNLKVIETPEFMRGIYAVGGFNPAPALQPRLGAFYWVTPIPSNWPKQRIESKLREYNTYGIQELTIHEAMPGHYVQTQYANEVQPPDRRALRALYGNGPYVEGWAVYAQQLMSDEGYLNNSKDLRMTFLKQMLRVISNTILDIRLQTLGMTDEQAMDLMLNQAYQEKEEATAKLQRAKLSSVQLATYFAGWRGWLRVRSEYEKRAGASFKLAEFHRKALSEGAVPLPALGNLLTQ